VNRPALPQLSCRRKCRIPCGNSAGPNTGDGYHDDHGGADALHQRFVTGLGQWLGEQSLASGHSAMRFKELSVR
jgi:hypothetical protein